MISFQSISLIALFYLTLLFFVAYIGDSSKYQRKPIISSNIIYALSLAVYCSSWTFYGAVGTAATIGFDYLAIYFGPLLVFVFGYPIVRRVIIICKHSNITSISDFIASRYGKSRRIGVLVTVIAMIGSLPYIALQLKAVSMTFTELVNYSQTESVLASNTSADIAAFYTGVILAIFAILFGTRHLDSTEHHRGMVLAIAFESIVKLLVILAIGYYAVFLLLGSGDHDSFSQLVFSGASRVAAEESSATWISFSTKTFLAMGAILLLPRQFQVTIVEAFHYRQYKTAMWMMPFYFVLTSITVIPIALAGVSMIPEGQADLYVLTLPLVNGNELLSIVAFIGGFSAATGMVIVAVISLSTMVCNDLVMPGLNRFKSFDILNNERLDKIILLIRRIVIVVMIAGSYGYYKIADYNTNLGNIGILAFAAIFLFVPAFLCSLFWRRANSEGVFWGLLIGFLVWAYTLLLPTIFEVHTINLIWAPGAWTHPQSLFGFTLDNSLTHGVIWSTAVNLGLIIFFSFKNEQSVLERLQASRFFRAGDSKQLEIGDELYADTIPVHPDTLKILAERIIGTDNTEKVFSEYEKRWGKVLSAETEVNRKLLSLVQTAIVSVIGAPSAQKVISETILGGEDYLEEATAIVDGAYTALRFNRNLLQTALENISQGISVVDEDLNIVVWNNHYLEIFDYPKNFIYVGKPIKDVLEYNARRGDFHDKNGDEEICKRLKYLTKGVRHQSVRERPNGVIVKSVGEPMPGGGFVTTYENITERVNASEQLRAANEELEYRVKERTKELETLTEELEKNTRSKTHFLAAASHDLLQPINAARLFTHSIQEQNNNPDEVIRLSKRVDKSLANANELLRALLDISKLDAGGIEPEAIEFSLLEFIEQVSREFEPIAESKGIKLTVDVLPLWTVTDKQLLLSVLQNFMTNAIRYTNSSGTVHLSVHELESVGKLSTGYARISVADNGAGIDEAHLEIIFKEFYQVKTGENKIQVGLGLGLSIVERISRLLGLSVGVSSQLGEGSTFSIDVPISPQALKEVKQQDSAELNPGEQLFKETENNQLDNIKVLCVDNDVDVLEAMEVMLAGWGCNVSCANSFKLAEKLMKKEVYHFVLADYRLDFDETGIDVLKLIKHYPHLNNVCGLLITAEQDNQLGIQVSDLGFHYLEKPIAPATLKLLMTCLLTVD